MASADAARLLYLDSSAIVKLVVREAESDALEAHVEAAELATSEAALTEVPRAAHLRTRTVDAIDRAEMVLRRFFVIALDEELHRAAARRLPRELRALDAIHLVSALRLGERLTAVVAYDRRLAQAIRDAGLLLEAPGAPGTVDDTPAGPDPHGARS